MARSKVTINKQAVKKVGRGGSEGQGEDFGVAEWHVVRVCGPAGGGDQAGAAVALAGRGGCFGGGPGSFGVRGEDRGW